MPIRELEETIMKAILLSIFIIIFVACDAPSRPRNPYYVPVTSTDTDADTDTKTNPDQATGDTNQDDQNKNNDTTQVEAGFENCSLGYIYYASSIGNFGICKNTQNEMKYKVKLANGDSSNGTCFVPIHINSDGSSYHLGPAECVHHEGGKEYSMTLSKDRSENINGVMVLKANALNPYMQCMTAKMQYINNYYNCQYNQSCLQAADNWAYQVCNNFIQVYEGYFYQVSF